MRRLRAFVAVALGVVGVGLPSAALANDAGSVTHASGAVSATLEWDQAESGIGNPRLFVTRSGVRYDQPIADICLEGCIVVPDEGIEDASQSALKVADLNGDGEPEILVDVFSGGAHCCVTTRLLSWNGTGYATKDIFWGDLGYVLKDADDDGRQELVGADPRFSGAFTAYAGSGFPPQVLAVGAGGAVSDVTRSFPALVRADAAKRLKVLRKASRRRGDDVRGIAAAYVADEYLLGHGSVGTRELDRLARARLVTVKFKAYVLKKLKAWGYRGGVAKASAAASVSLDRVTLNGYSGVLSVASTLAGAAGARDARFGLTVTKPEVSDSSGSSGGGSHATIQSRVAERGRPPLSLKTRPVPCGGFTAVVGTVTPRIAKVVVRHADGSTDGLRLRKPPAAWHDKGHFVGQFLDSASKLVSARALDSSGHTVLRVTLAGGGAC